MPRKVPIDWKIVDEMLYKGFEGKVIASHFGISYDTFERRGQEENIWGKECQFPNFAEYKASKKERMQSNLLAKQIEIAEKGNPVMLIWLGKNLLNQADKLETKTEEKVTINFVD